ncbi:hypothetical protein E0Z10_g5614 [Xylaria hypoxylon]|uniref:Tesmin/TSO1-like CXC domain-containing protein n=1 Tax=Xylaria hypoxylon TaxID=37992 RepID=A0A4Z0YGL0_9PEZI|nr:hypothetical protein E0Z10_g5614 [Xylaria hypoxylon]
MDGSGVNTMKRLHPEGVLAARPVSWSAIPADDPAAHEQMIKYISESIVDGMQGNISSGFMRQVHASKKSTMSPHDKAERMRIVRRMRTTLERLTEELGQKFFDEFSERPAVGRWYDSWLLNEPPQFLRWEQEWALTTEENLAVIDARSVGMRSVAGSIDERVFGSETTPEVRVEFSEDLEESEDTQEFTQAPEYRPDAPVAETKTDGCAPSAMGCHCEHEHESSDSEKIAHLCQTCACSNQGYGCIASCGCDETCQNNFNNIALDKILGADDSGFPVKLDPCFITYLQKHKLDRVITLDYLFEHLLSGLDYVPDGNDPEIDAWRVTWETAYSGPDPEARTEELQRQLLRLGLEPGDKRGDWFFSFCYSNTNGKSGTAENATSARTGGRSRVADAEEYRIPTTKNKRHD